MHMIQNHNEKVTSQKNNFVDVIHILDLWSQKFVFCIYLSNLRLLVAELESMTLNISLGM